MGNRRDKAKQIVIEKCTEMFQKLYEDNPSIDFKIYITAWYGDRNVLRQLTSSVLLNKKLENSVLGTIKGPIGEHDFKVERKTTGRYVAYMDGIQCDGRNNLRTHFVMEELGLEVHLSPRKRSGGTEYTDKTLRAIVWQHVLERYNNHDTTVEYVPINSG